MSYAATLCMANRQASYVVIAGVDFSDASELAVKAAFEAAGQRPDSEVHLVHVVQTYGAQVAYDAPVDASALAVVTLAEARKRFTTYTEQVVARYSTPELSQRIRRVVPHIRFDAIASEIAQLAADLEADLVVVGTHGRRGLPRLLLGSTAETTTRLAPCPVLVVRPKAVPEPLPLIEPPCPKCVDVRFETRGAEMWCEQHRERHGQRHTYHQGDRTSSDSEMPLLYHH